MPALTVRIGSRETARYGLRARRIGEAEHPEPYQQQAPDLRTDRRARIRHVIWRLQEANASDRVHFTPSEELRTRIVQPPHGAKTAAKCIASLARRSQGVPAGRIPREVHEQRWSALNVPIMWNAASTDDMSPLVQWLAYAAEGAPQVDIGVRPVQSASSAAVDGWRALRQRMRAWGIMGRDDLADHLETLEYRRTEPGQHLSQAAQERILDQAIAEDETVALLDASYVVTTLHLAKQPGLAAELETNVQMRNRDGARQQQPLVRRAGQAVHRHCASHEPGAADAEMRRAGIGELEQVEPRTPSVQMRDLFAAGPSIPGAAPDAPPTPSPATRPTITARRRNSGAGGEADRLPAEPPASAWEQLDRVDLRETFLLRTRVLQSCPQFLRGRYRHAQRIALEAIDEAIRAQNAQQEQRAWKLFGLLSALLLHRTHAAGRVGKQALEDRFAAFARGEWLALLEASKEYATDSFAGKRTSEEHARQARRNRAEAKVKLEECSKARQVLTQSELAPGTQATHDELTDPTRRPPELAEAIPNVVLQYSPDRPLDIKFKLFVETLRATARGSSGGPGGTTYEHLKVALDDEDTAALLHRSALRFARAEVPADIAEAFMAAKMTALRKPNGGVRGIATGTSFRRIVATCLARIVGPAVEQACAPFQYALSTRAGTECVSHLFRAATDGDHTKCILSIDGIGAFDHVKRASMLTKLYALPNTRFILPFVRMSYASPTRYRWHDDEGKGHDITQGEGGEQGDPLMPLLFALGIHDALEEVSRQLRPDEDLCAFLDDVYALASPERIRPIYELLQAAMRRHAGIELHAGKTKVWNRAGECPPNIADIGRDGAWCPAGLMVLGAPVGTDEFVKGKAAERLEEEKAFLAELVQLRDPQCAWQLLSRCAVPRGNYWLRTLPPSLSSDYAASRDELLWEAAVTILGASGLPQEVLQRGREIAELPARLGGLGIRSCTRTREAAYWASWADALEMIHKRNPELAGRFLATLEASNASNDGCLHELKLAAQRLDEEWFDNRPAWRALAEGVRPPPLPTTHGADERTPGWQYFASSTREIFARTKLLQSRCRPTNASMRSQAGPGASLAIMSAPSQKGYSLTPEQFQSTMRRRLRWPLPLVAATCEGCGERLDELGNHYAACMRSGRPKIRASAVETTVAQICREAGARVRTNVRLRDLNVAVPASDERRIEVVASGLPAFGGAQLAVDVTARSPLTAAGNPKPRAAWQDGAVAESARADKESSYPELASGSRCRLVVLAIETGGRFSHETCEFIRQLAWCKAQSAPAFLRGSVATAFEKRWGRLLAIVVASSVVDSLLLEKDALACAPAQAVREPWLLAVLADGHDDVAGDWPTA